MRKRTIAVIMTIVCLFLFVVAGCASPMDEDEQKNFIFTEDFSLVIPDIKEFETFELVAKQDLSPERQYELFDKAVEQYFPGVFTSGEKTALYKIVGNGKDGERIQGIYALYEDKFLSGEITSPWIMFNCEKGMIQMLPNGELLSVTRDRAYKTDHPEEDSVGMYCAAEENAIQKKYHVPIGEWACDDSYLLLDGNIKLTDAVGFTEQFLNTEYDTEIGNTAFVADVTDVWVLDMGDQISGYHFWLTLAYKDIRFDTYPMKRGLGFQVDMSDCKAYELYPGYAFMIEKDQFDSIMCFGNLRAYNIQNIQSHHLEMTFEDAVDKLAESVSDAVNMEISRAEFVYTPFYKDKSDTGHVTVEAAWKFQAINKNDIYNYVFYVNALTGDVDYYKF